MKTSSLTYLAAVGCLLLVPAAFSQTVADATINARGPNHRVWEWTERERTALGADMYRTNSYTELKSGLHYPEAGEWKETVEAFEITPEGYAIARRGPTKVVISPVLNDAEGAVDLEAADGKRLRMTLLGLSLFDRASGRSLQVAAAGPSVGQQVAENVILFTNCFAESGFAASVRYVYRAAEFHQDVLLAEKLDVALLEEAGFPADSTVLEIWSEVFAGPEPTVRERVVKRETNGELRKRMAEPDVVDQHLDFGELKMPVAGKAYLEADGKTLGQPVSVYKRWLELDEGRRFLVETIPLATLQPLFAMLPESNSPFDAPAKERYYAGRRPPRPTLAQRNGESILLAQLDRTHLGPQLVLDYETISGTLPNHTFRGDTTWYLSGSVYAGGVALEGGTVLKFAAGASLGVNGAVNCLTSEYRPAIFTAKDDNTVGEVIQGSTGTPSGYYAATALGSSQDGVTLRHVRIKHAQTAVYLETDAWWPEGMDVIRDVQFVNCALAFSGYSSGVIRPMVLGNVLFSDVTWGFSMYDVNVTAEHLTVHNCEILANDWGGMDNWYTIRNSVLSEVDTLSVDENVTGSHNGFHNSPTFGSSYWETQTLPFQTAGAGSYYLKVNPDGSDASGFRNKGTTAINTDLLAALKKKTTYRPTEITANITSTTVWSPQAQRDTKDGDALDLGWHYNPIDYVVNAKTVSAELTLNEGVVVGTYRSAASYGLGLTGSGSLVSQGTPNNLNWIVRYNTVQEQSTGAWSSSTAGAGVMKLSSSATVKTRFTGWSVLGGTGDHFYDDSGGLVPSAFSHSQFGGGRFYVYPGSIALTNSLWERVHVYLRDMDGNPEMYLFNNLFFGGKLEYRITEEPILRAYDNFFDRTTIVRGSGSAYFTHDYNGYITGQTRLTPNATHDTLVSSITYTAGQLGSFYQASTDLVNKGSRNAPAAGLFHYTTRTTQQKEGFSQVDIGLHYVALDANGLPADANTDGTADYLADANGNGIVDLPAEAQTPWFNTQGEWSSSFLFGDPPPPAPPDPDSAIPAIHAALLPNGKVLYWFDLSHVRLYNYDPENPTAGVQGIAPPGFHIFCAGHTLMADGSVLVAGGDVGTPAGLKSMAAYSPVDNFWTRLPAMNEGRWYPTCTTLANGEVLITSGCFATGHPSLPYVEAAPALDVNTLPQVWNPATGQFRNLENATRKLPLYPFTFLAPDGRVFYAGSTLTTANYFYPLGPEPGETVRTTKYLNTEDYEVGTPKGQWATTGFDQNNYHQHYPIAVMYEPGKILVSGGVNPQTALAVKDAEMIDLNQQSPAWTTVSQMNYARQNHNATLLADGTLLVTGGNSTSDDNPDIGGLGQSAVKKAELWEPMQQNWTELAECPMYRGYHSTALLLPDGRVLSAGGQPPTPGVGFENASTAEIFTPPYLLKGPEESRPVIVSAPATVSYGNVFGLQTAPADTVLKVTMLRLGSVTHSFNMNQRFLNPSFTSAGNGSWNVTAPAEPTKCPPGHYLLFVINNVGVPSTAKMIQVLPSSAPDVAMVCPANGGIVSPGNIKVSARVKNPAGNQTVKFYYRDDFGGPSQLIAEAGEPYSITWAQNVAGRYHLKARKVGPDVDSPEITVTVKSFPHGHASAAPPQGALVFNYVNDPFDYHYAFPIKLTAPWDSSITLTELYANRPGEQNTSVIRATQQAGNNIVNFPYTWPNARSGVNVVWTMAVDDTGLDLHGSGPLMQIYGGAMDTSFTPDAPNNTVRAVAVQPDGKVLIGGDFTSINGNTRGRIARLKDDGILDGGFQFGLAGANGAVHSIVLQPDGKVLVAGAFTTVNGTGRNGIARLNDNGALDETFNPTSGATGTDPTVYSVALQPDGKVLIGGAFTFVNGTGRNRIARLNNNGSLDTGFNPNVTGGAAPVVYSIAVQPNNPTDPNDDQVLLGGAFTTVGATGRNRIARLTASGGLDTGFNPGTGPDDSVRSVAVQADGKVVIGGNFTAVAGSGRNCVARLNADGSRDDSFLPGTAVGGSTPVVYSVAVQLNGQVLIAGQFTSAKGNHIARLHGGGLSPGTLDDSFRPGPADQVSGLGADNVVRALAIAPDGLLLVGGEFSTYKVPGQDSEGNPQPLSRGPRIARVGGL